MFGGWLTADAWGDLWHLGWADAESSHVLLVPVVFAWLVWVRRGRLAGCCGGRGRWPGAMVLSAGVLLWVVGYRYQVQSFWHVGAVGVVAGGVLVVLGREALWRFLPAWAVLAFLVPVPLRVRMAVALPMEQWTARLTQAAGETVGVDIGRSGNQLSVGGVDVCVAEACNGLRLVFTLALACYVATFCRPYKAWVRAAVLAATPAVAVGCNVVRLVPTVWVFGHYPAATAERFHDAAGWVMLVVAFGILTGSCRLLEWVGVSVLDDTAGVPAGVGVGAGVAGGVSAGVSGGRSTAPVGVVA